MMPLAANIFLRLVRIDSPTFGEENLREFIIHYFRKEHIRYRIDRIGNIIARVPGAGKPLILSAHMDTVSPCCNARPVVHHGVIYSRGNTILGADDKAGIASILALITQLRAVETKHRALEIVFTVQEEVYCQGAKQLDFSLLQGKEAVVLDRSASPNSMTVRTPTIAAVSIVCQGKASHARSPEEGVDAIKMFSDFVTMVRPGRKSATLVSNIGVVSGGKTFNVVPSSVTAQGEIRSLHRNMLSREYSAWKKAGRAVEISSGGRMILKQDVLIDGFSVSRSNHVVIMLAQAIKQAGFKPVYTTALGASDANVFSQHGITAVPLGQGRSGAHSISESIPVQAFIDTDNILQHVVRIC